MAVHALPDLPSDHAALEPYISGEVMELHHDRHHHADVTGVNTAVDQLAEARETTPACGTRTTGPVVKGWWNVVSWANAQVRFERARSHTSGLIP